MERCLWHSRLRYSLSWCRSIQCYCSWKLYISFHSQTNQWRCSQSRKEECPLKSLFEIIWIIWCWKLEPSCSWGKLLRRSVQLKSTLESRQRRQAKCLPTDCILCRRKLTTQFAGKECRWRVKLNLESRLLNLLCKSF